MRYLRIVLYLNFVILIFLFFFASCYGNYTIPEDAYYPLKIGVFLVADGDTTGVLRYIQPGETILTRQSCDYNNEATVNINLSFEIDGGTCVLTSENQDVQICKQKGAVLFYQKYFGNWEDMSFSFSESVGESGFLAAAPLGGSVHHLTGTGTEFDSTLSTLKSVPAEEHAYFLTIDARTFDGKPVVSAKLKLVNLATTQQNKKSDYYEITLEEYTLSDNYMMFLQ